MFFALPIAIAVHCLILWYLWERMEPSQKRTRRKAHIYGGISFVLFAIFYILGRSLDSVPLIAIASGMAVLPTGVVSYFLLLFLYDALAQAILRLKGKGPKT